MPKEISERELAEARDTAEELPTQLGLSACRFAVEPRADHWEVRGECAPNGSWRLSVFSVEEGWLSACRSDPSARTTLPAEWRKRLRA